MKFVRRNLRYILPIAALCCIIVIVSYGASYLFTQEAVRRCADEEAPPRGVVQACSDALWAPWVNEGRDTFLAYRSKAYLKLGEGAASLADADAIVALRPLDAIALARRAYTKSALGRAEDAAADFTSALGLASEKSGVLKWRAEAAEERGDFAEALAEYEQIAVEHPDDAAIAVKRAAMHGKLLDFGLSLELMEQAVRLEPDNLEYLEALGHHRLYYSGNCGKAIEAFEAVAQEVEGIETALLLAIIYFQIGDLERGKFYAQYGSTKVASENTANLFDLSLIEYRIYHFFYPAYSMGRIILIEAYARYGPLDLALAEVDILLANGGVVARRYLRNSLEGAGYPAAGSGDDDLRAAFIAYANAQAEDHRTLVSGLGAPPTACWG